MKVLKLPLMLMLPLVLGLLVNVTFMLPRIGVVAFVLSPFILIAYWFYIGGFFYREKISPVRSFILGNSVHLVMLGFYVWQYNYVLEADRNPLISFASQLYVTPLFMVTGKLCPALANAIGVRCPAPNEVLNMMVFGSVMLIVTFGAGYYHHQLSDKKALSFAKRIGKTYAE